MRFLCGAGVRVCALPPPRRPGGPRDPRHTHDTAHEHLPARQPLRLHGAMLQPRAHEHHEGRGPTAVRGVEYGRTAVGADQTAESEVKGTEAREVEDVAE